MAVIFIYLKGIQRSIVFKLNINNNNKLINLIIFSYNVVDKHADRTSMLTKNPSSYIITI